ncbi:MAG: orotate phosphoribosyltransferase [Clostridiales Family XIII bacterium]|jgi:orotate phosphoribosyltransferase|nr:orotate phosphoribosyltransferase [Clostridiales Family XIII bacterium]
MHYKSEFIEFLIGSGALQFGDFITKSGRRSPYFINTGAFDTGARIDKVGSFYAACMFDHMERGALPRDIDAIFGPAYKGIPLAVSASIALARDHGMEVGCCFNRKEAKDHGEGGNLVGAKLKAGDKVILTDDVITAGTALREALAVIRGVPNVDVTGLIISVDRMERGQGALSAAEEARRDLGVEVFPIVTVRDILTELDGKRKDGILILDEGRRREMEEYMARYCSDRSDCNAGAPTI